MTETFVGRWKRANYMSAVLFQFKSDRLRLIVVILDDEYLLGRQVAVKHAGSSLGH